VEPGVVDGEVHPNSIVVEAGAIPDHARPKEVVQPRTHVDEADPQQFLEPTVIVHEEHLSQVCQVCNLRTD